MKSQKRPVAVVIDDDAASAWGLALLLRDSGYHAIAGADSISVQERLDAEGLEPDVAVCDFHLQTDENGVIAAERLRHVYETMFPVVIVTGSPGHGPRDMAREHGFPVVSKPVDPDDLMFQLDQLSPDTGGPAVL